MQYSESKNLPMNLWGNKEGTAEKAISS
jgi:hypothetical protein